MTAAGVPSLGDARVLITGGAGFVGGNLVRAILASSPGARISVVDNLLSAERFNVPDDSRVTFVEGSIADDEVLAGVVDDLDHVFHLATFHGNQSSIHDPLADHDNNLITTLKLFERLRSFRRLRSVVYAAAGCAAAEKTFDGARATGEDAPLSLAQDSPYSISKLVGECYAVYYHRRHGLPTVRARFQNVYGPGEVLGAGRWRGTPATVWRNVVPTFVWKALHGEPLPVENGGVATRDFIYVDDICRGLLACALRGAAGAVYNVATGREASILSLAELVNRLTGNQAGVEFLPPRPWDSSGQRYGDPARARVKLGFEAEVSLEQGLERTIDWTRTHESLIAACIRRHDREMERATRG